MNMRNITDLVFIILLLTLTAYTIRQERALDRSYARENEMYAYASQRDNHARDWEAAAGNYRSAADAFQQAAVSCLARSRETWQPLLERQPFDTFTPAWTLPLGVVGKQLDDTLAIGPTHGP